MRVRSDAFPRSRGLSRGVSAERPLAASLDPLSLVGLLAADAQEEGRVRVGLVTDLHYADKKPAGTRWDSSERAGGLESPASG